MELLPFQNRCLRRNQASAQCRQHGPEIFSGLVFTIDRRQTTLISRGQQTPEAKTNRPQTLFFRSRQTCRVQIIAGKSSQVRQRGIRQLPGHFINPVGRTILRRLQRLQPATNFIKGTKRIVARQLVKNAFELAIIGQRVNIFRPENIAQASQFFEHSVSLCDSIIFFDRSV
ncbi:MAG: hypothetical protein ACD_10C00828G0001 [uncultured bacterium]|nr:MAG: hypothetical protein ACD_10C00828G0001 [uncultured bacterium]